MPENVKNSAVENTDVKNEVTNKPIDSDQIKKNQENSVRKQKLLEKRQSYSDVMDSFDEVNKLEDGKIKTGLLKNLWEATIKLDVNDTKGAKDILSSIDDKILDITMNKVNLWDWEKEINSADIIITEEKKDQNSNKQQIPDIWNAWDGIDNISNWN